ncbi:MAG: hypothetical protein K2O18_12175 [Oscillospiraceae bacterium]|nr:hypothetical protein [Oscillospiraceae bacterium]
MEIYYYCSYTGSPTGFQLGKLTNAGQNMGLLALEKQNVSELIQRCFDLRAVRRAYQYPPEPNESNEFFFLLKGLTAQGKGPDEPEMYYINFAVVTGREAEFQKCFRGGDVSDCEIAEAVRGTIQPDPNSEFGFQIRGEKAAKLLKLSLRAQRGEINDRKGTFLKLLCRKEKEDLNQLIQALKLDGFHLEEVLPTERTAQTDLDKTIEKEGTWFVKKKLRRTNLPILILIALVAAAMFLLLYAVSPDSLSHYLKETIASGG